MDERDPLFAIYRTWCLEHTFYCTNVLTAWNPIKSPSRHYVMQTVGIPSCSFDMHVLSNEFVINRSSVHISGSPSLSKPIFSQCIRRDSGARLLRMYAGFFVFLMCNNADHNAAAHTHTHTHPSKNGVHGVHHPFARTHRSRSYRHVPVHVHPMLNNYFRTSRIRH